MTRAMAALLSIRNNNQGEAESAPLCLKRFKYSGKMHLMKNPHAVALGRLGGLKGGARGGRARAKSLPARRRQDIARDAAIARWSRVPELLGVLFPGYRLGDLKLPNDLDLVMLHVLTRGAAQHRRWLVGRFGDEKIRHWIQGAQGRGLTVRQMAPWIPASVARRWQASNPYALIWENR